MLGDSVRRRQSPRRASTPSQQPRRPLRWKPLLIALPFAIALPFLIGYLIATRLVFPPPQVGAAGVAVPDLVGRSAEEAQRTLVAAGLGELQATELPHPSVPNGQVVAQSPLPGQQLRGGTPVQVALSAGPPRGMVPDLQGFGVERAELMLRRSGFGSVRAEEESAMAAGRVLRTDPAAGVELVLPASVTLVVSTGPPPPDPLPPDTFAEPPPDRS
jgi:beta-lactam-binding protein with PASTA domain